LFYLTDDVTRIYDQTSIRSRLGSRIMAR